ncbi:MAG: CCA tRNA nucleotidyltransferase [bacterium]
MSQLAPWQESIVSRGSLYLVGGSVRDGILLGASKDLDFLVTRIPADELIALLEARGRVDVVGRSFGVIRFIPDGASAAIDIALPRRETSTGSGHRDFAVDFDPDIPVEADLGRRDFTINAMAQDVATGALIDPFDGLGDLRARRLRAVSPRALREDPLRMLRAVQFAARFALDIEPETLRAMTDDAHLVTTVSGERIAEEITKLLTLAEKPSTGFAIMRKTGLLAHLFPELSKCDGVAQPPEWHRHDVLEHSLITCDAAPRDNLAVRLAALLHDTGKADCRQEIFDEKLERHRIVFYGHEEASRRDAAAVLARLRYPRALADRVDALIACHMFDYHAGWSDAAVRRLMARIGIDAIGDLIALRRADQIGSGFEHDTGATDELMQRIEKELEKKSATTVRDLAIGGNDIMRTLAIDPGPQVGRILAMLLEEVLENPVCNTRENLLARARQIGNDGSLHERKLR